MSIYKIHRTHQSDPENFEGITVDEKRIDQSTDLTFFGRQRLQYGQDMNQNILHLLETFSLPEKDGEPGVPDLEQAAQDQTSLARFLSKPVDGQLWFNQTRDCLYFWSEEDQKWVPMGMQDDLAANWGIIYHGQTIPKPVSAITGRVFEYDECSWIVSPYNFPDQLSFMACSTNENAVVTSRYGIEGGDFEYYGYATYLIVGIRDNHNIGSIEPYPSPTPTPTNSRTPTPTRTKTPLVSQSSTPAPVIPTPTPTSRSRTPLSVSYSIDPPIYNAFYDGPINKEFWPGEPHMIPYPGICNGNKIPKRTLDIYYKGRSPFPVSNPWEPYPYDPYKGNYIIWLSTIVKETGESIYDALRSGTSYIFCSHDGINGIMYTGSILRGISSGAMAAFSLGLSGAASWRFPPDDVGPEPGSPLTFDYTHVYLVREVIREELYGFNPPTGYEQSITLNIWGGEPPYEISDIWSDNNDKGFPTYRNLRVAATYAGMGYGNINPPLRLAEIDSRETGNAGSALFKGEVKNERSPDISDVIISGEPGKRIANFSKVDLYYPVNYIPYPGAPPINYSDPPHWGVGRPRQIWNWRPLSNEGFGGSESINVGQYSNHMTDGLHVTVKDSRGSTTRVYLPAHWMVQTIDWRPPATNFGYRTNFTPVGFDPRDIRTPGTYSWDVSLSVNNSPASTGPIGDFSKCRYFFSMISPKTTELNLPGNWTYSILAGSPELTQHTTNGLCYLGAGNSNTGIGLLHAYDSTTWPLLNGVTLQPYTGTSGDRQAIEINSYISDGQVVDIRNNPILVSLYPVNSSNTFVRKKIPDNESISSTTPEVPPNLRLSVTIPPGLTKAGYINIPIASVAYATNYNCHLYGNDGAQHNIQFNFNFDD